MSMIDQAETTMGEQSEDIEAEIARELAAIEIKDDGIDEKCEESSEQDGSDDVYSVGEDMFPSMQEYMNAIQKQTQQFESELAECDDLLHESEIVSSRKRQDTELDELAKAQGMTEEALKLKILAELEKEDEEDEKLLEDYKADDFLTQTDQQTNNNKPTESDENLQNSERRMLDCNSDSTFMTEKVLNGDVENMRDRKTDVANGNTKVNQQKTETDSIPDTESLQVVVYGEIEELERKQRQELRVLLAETQKNVQEKRKISEEIKKEEERRNRLIEEKRRRKQEEIAAEEMEIEKQKRAQERQTQLETDELQKTLEASLKVYEHEIQTMSEVLQHEKESYTKQRHLLDEQKIEREQQSAAKIQALYRGHKVRKKHGSELKEKIKEMKEQRMEDRIQEIHVERLRKGEEEKETKTEAFKLKAEQERLEREKKEKEATSETERLQMELKKKEEEIKRAEENRQKEIEEQKKKEEEQKKAEEKRRNEEDRKLEEEKLRKEKELKEEKLRKEIEEKEEKLRKERERLEEEKRQKEKQRIEEEQRLAEKRRKEEERIKKQRIEEDNRKKEALRLEEEKRKEKERIEEEKRKRETEEAKKRKEIEMKLEEERRKEVALLKEKEKSQDKRETSKNTEIIAEKTVETSENVTAFKHEMSEDEIRRRNREQQKALQEKLRRQEEERKRVKCAVSAESAALEDWGDFLPKNLDEQRLTWVKECQSWSTISSSLNSRKPVPSKRPPRRPSSAKTLQPLDERLVLNAAKVAMLQQVTTVELQDLPGCSPKTLSQCVNLKTLSMMRCNLVTIEGLESCTQLELVNFKDNNLEVLCFKDHTNLIYLDVSSNKLSSIHGLDGCTNLRYLNCRSNKITRLGGLDSLKCLHSLDLSHNQLIKTKGLSSVPTVQVLNLSHNHLPNVDDLDTLALLQHLDVEGNSLMQVPKMTNHVLTNHLVLDENSIPSLSGLKSSWLPLLRTLKIAQNSLTDLKGLDTCVSLSNLDISNNQILDLSNLIPGLCRLRSLHSLATDGNPVCEDTSFTKTVRKKFPFLVKLDETDVTPSHVIKRTQFETMCAGQIRQVQELKENYLQSLKKGVPVQDQAKIHRKYFIASQQLAIDQRYSHEYGMTMLDPKPPVPKDLDLDFDLDSTNEVKASQPEQENEGHKQAVDMKNKFEMALQSANNSSRTTPRKKTVSQNGDLSSDLGFKQPRPPDQRPAESRPSQWQQRANSAEKQRLANAPNINNSAVVNGNKMSNGGVMNAPKPVVDITHYSNVDYKVLHQAAVKIQSTYRGYLLRKRLMLALNYAKFLDSDEEDDEFGGVDMDEFNFDEDDLDKDWAPPSTPQIPQSHPILGKQSSVPAHHQPVPPLFDKPPQHPNPKQAWRNSPALDNVPVKPPLPPLSRMSDVGSDGYTHRTGMSKKEEKIQEEWGFKDGKTAELMMARAKKLKYNSLKKKKLSKLDPKQRLALFRKLEETSHLRPMMAPPARKQQPQRVDYFTAKEAEQIRQEREKTEEKESKKSRTFEWVHTQVGDYDVGDESRISKKRTGETSLPKIDPNVIIGGRALLTGSPVSQMDLQSIESASMLGQDNLPKPRRLSLQSRQSSAGSEKFPPIQSNSAPQNRKPEKMTWRPKPVQESVGWGGGRKRNKMQP